MMVAKLRSTWQALGRAIWLITYLVRSALLPIT